MAESSLAQAQTVNERIFICARCETARSCDVTVTLLALILLPLSHATFCRSWTEPATLGALPKCPVDEASGVAISKQHTDRVYWINDSGDRGRIFHSPLNGKNPVTIRVEGLEARDAEALTMTECDSRPCLIVGDIGDNRAGRKRSERRELELFFVPEPTGESARVSRRLKIRYPDRAHDAEAMVTLPSGDLLIITKEWRLTHLNAGGAGIYSVPKSILHDSSLREFTLTKLGELPLETWFPEEGMLGQAVTDAAVNTRRQVLGLLTYINAIEIPLAKIADLAHAARWKSGVDFALVPLRSLKQQETMFYTDSPDRLVWSSERIPPKTPILAITCKEEMKP